MNTARAWVLGIGLAACGGGETDVTVLAQMPSAEGLSTDDGWVLTFTSWVSSIDQIELSDDAGIVQSGNGNTNIALDFTGAQEPVWIVTFRSPQGQFDVNFGSEVPQIGVARANNDVTDNVLVRMDSQGWTHLFRGEAFGPLDDDYMVPILGFEFGFDVPARQLSCGEGLDVRGDEVTTTIELEPAALFWTSLSERGGPTAFEMMAQADGNADGFVDTDELKAFGLGDLNGEGRANNLYQFMRLNAARSMQLAAVDGAGIGVCDTRL